MSKLYINKNKLINFMKDNDLSEREFAKIIEVDHTTVNRILRDKRNPGPKFVAGVMKNTSLEFDDIFFIRKLPTGKEKNQQSA